MCTADRSDGEQIKVLLETVQDSLRPSLSDWFWDSGPDGLTQNTDRSVVTRFLQALPIDYATKELQKMIRLMKQMHFFPAAFKCYRKHCNFDSLITDDDLCYKIFIHVHSDSEFRRYEKEMRGNRGLWPLYRGFFVDVSLFKDNNQRSEELAKGAEDLLKSTNGSLVSNLSAADVLADAGPNLMLKLKFLTYKKLRTYLIRDGLPTLFNDGIHAYGTFCWSASYS